MANLIEVPGWEPGIYQLETTDPVEGGPAGIDNLQAKQLANRTAHLKQLVETLGTGKQPIDDLLVALAALVTSADKLPYFTGVDTVAQTTLTAFMRTVLAAVDAAAARAVLGAASPADIATAVANLVASSPATLDTLNELAAALGNDANFAATMAASLGAKAPLDSPDFTGAPTAPTAAAGTNTTQLANTAFVAAALAGLAYAQLGVAQSWTKAQRGAVVPLADGATITPDFSLSNNFSVTLGGNRTLAAPTNLVAGQSGIITITQDATGSRALAFAAAWKFAGGVAPTLTSTANAKDQLMYYVNADGTTTFAAVAKDVK